MNRRAPVLAFALASLALGFFARTPDTGGVALRDFEAYDAAGSTWHYHGDPYGREIWRAERTIPGVVATRLELLPFVGPPFGLPLWDALSRLPWGAAVAVWRAVMLLSFAAVVLCALRLASGTLDAFGACAALALGAAFAPLTSGAALGQVAVPACAAIVAVPLLLRVRFAFAAALGMLVAALQPNLAIALVARLRERRSWIAAASALAIAIGGSVVALAGLGGIGHYLDVLHAHSGAERDAAIQTTVAAVVRGFGASDGIARTAAVAAGLAAVAVLAVQCRSRRYGPDECLILACAALPLVQPFAHEHDFNVTFLPAAAVACRASGVARVLGLLGTIALSVDWLGLAQRPGSTLEACALAAAAGLAWTALAPRRSLFESAAPIGGAVLCVALIALPAATHSLPTWPDRLPAAFSAPRTMPAAEVWRAEQTATGIMAHNSYWAALRLCSLGGAALLWISASMALTAPLPRSERLATSPGRRAAVYPSA